jgi:hypothetical protein
MPSPQSPLNTSAIGWALLSQAIWLPLVAIEAQDQWKAHVRKNSVPAIAKAPSPDDGTDASRTNKSIASLLEGSEPSSTSTTGFVLGSAGRSADALLNDPLVRSIETKGSGMQALLPSRQISPSPLEGFRPGSPPVAVPGFHGSTGDRPAAESLLQRSFTRAELLGGPITLHDPDPGPMPNLARAERARWATSGDPMAPLPAAWRAPMRQAIEHLPSSPTTPASPTPSPRLQTARVVHVPSSRISKSTEVPLALQSDGSVDILSQPDDPAVVEEISNWSARQKAPSPGTVAPAVVHLHPLPEAPADPVVSASEPVAPAADEPRAAASIPAPPPPLEPSAPVESLP